MGRHKHTDTHIRKALAITMLGGEFAPQLISDNVKESQENSTTEGTADLSEHETVNGLFADLAKLYLQYENNPDPIGCEHQKLIDAVNSNCPVVLPAFGPLTNFSSSHFTR